MFSVVSSLLLAQTSPVLSFQPRQWLARPQEVRALPGKLNDVMVFNSNSPEVIKTEGILLSTFPSDIKAFPQAHLNKPLNGRFDFFSHHIARPFDSTRPLYQGAIVYNPNNYPVTLKVLQGISYLNSSDAPFIDLPSLVEDPQGQVFSGPGSRLTSDILRGRNQSFLPETLIISPQQSKMLFTLPMPVSSARSTFIRLHSSGPVYLANLAMYGIPEHSPNLAGKNTGKTDVSNSSPILPPVLRFREPAVAEWRKLLLTGQLVTPRDLPPTPLDNNSVERTIYSRVAGVSQGSEWVATISDRQDVSYLSIPQPGKAFSYPLSTVNRGTYGTQQIQSAPMLVRYPDTAYLAHGNYAVHYSLKLPLRNNTKNAQRVNIAIQTPLKQDQYSDRLFFVDFPQGQIFFRGTVRVSYQDQRGQMQTRYFHLVQRQGEAGNPLITLALKPGESRQVIVDFIYPPDATPPQVLTVETLP